MTVEELKIILRVNGASTYTHTINEVTNVTNNYKNSIGSLTSTLAKLVSAGLVAKFTKQCIEAASDLQEVANVTDVTFGQSAEIVNNWAKKQAANFGLSETAAKRYIGTYGTMAKQFNMTEKQAAVMGIELTKLTGDVASFYNITDKAAATKLKSVFTGETESLKELGVIMTETQLNAYAMSKGIEKPLKQMTEQEKVLLRYQFTMDKLSHAQGDFSKTSDSWANSTRTFQLELENLKVEIGKELLPVAAQGLSLVTRGLKAISPILISIAETIKLYVKAWDSASSTTKAFVKISLSVFAVLAVAPRVIAAVRFAMRLLTIETLTLGTALKALLGIAGLLIAGVAIANLTEEVQRLKAVEPAETIGTMGNSAKTSAGEVEDLSGAMGDLVDSTKDLDLFLTSFDEVNKVGGNETLMSQLINADDILNIQEAIDGLNELSRQVDTFDYSLDKVDVGTSLINSLDSAYAELAKFSPLLAELFSVWEDNGVKIYDFYQKHIKPSILEWLNDLEDLGDKVYDVTHGGGGKSAGKTLESAGKVARNIENYMTGGLLGLGEKASEKFVDWLGFSRNAAGGLPNKGSLFLAGETGPELISNFGSSQTKVLNQSQFGSTGESPIYFQPTILIDGRKVTATVVENINSMTRSSGNSPLIQLG